MPHCTYIREGHVCGAPSFQDPCSACLSYARTVSEKSGKPMQAPSPISVNARPSVTPAGVEPAKANTNPTTVAIAAIHNRLHHRFQMRRASSGVNILTVLPHDWEKLETDIAFLANQLGYQWPTPPVLASTVSQQIGSEDPTPPPVIIPAAEPSAAEPPATEPPATEPPATEPPATD